MKILNTMHKERLKYMYSFHTIYISSCSLSPIPYSNSIYVSQNRIYYFTMFKWYHIIVIFVIFFFSNNFLNQIYKKKNLRLLRTISSGTDLVNTAAIPWGIFPPPIWWEFSILLLNISSTHCAGMDFDVLSVICHF